MYSGEWKKVNVGLEEYFKMRNDGEQKKLK